MSPSRTLGRGRLAAAVLISVTLHAGLGLAWLHGRASGTAAGDGINDRVDGPEDDATVVVLLERPTPLPSPPSRSAEPASPPKDLPSSIIGPRATSPGAPLQNASSQAREGSLPKSGGPAPLHGKLEPGKTIVYILDRSSSMGTDGLLRRAVATLKASLEELGPDVRFQIVAYNGGTEMPGRQPEPATAAHIEEACRWLVELRPEGRSDHRAAFREALACHPDVLFLLTDADDLDEADVRSIAATFRTPVYLSAAVFTGQRPLATTPLERLTSQTGGRVKYVGREAGSR